MKLLFVADPLETFKVYKDGREVTSARFTISKTQK